MRKFWLITPPLALLLACGEAGRGESLATSAMPTSNGPATDSTAAAGAPSDVPGAAGTNGGDTPGVPAGGGASGDPASGGMSGEASASGGMAGEPSTNGGMSGEPSAGGAGGAAGASGEGGTAGAGEPRQVVFVAGDSNGTSQPGESIGERFIIERLEGWGHTVEVVPDGTPKGEMLAKAEAADLVVMGESLSSANVLDKLYTVSTTFYNMEAFLQDDMGLTAKGKGGDPGVPKDHPLGVKEGVTDLDIVAPQDPLAAGLSGTVAVYKVPKQMTWGIVGGDAQVVATLADDPDGAVLYYYEKGDTLFDGTRAAGTRITVFIEDDNETGTPNLMTEAGILLFDTSIQWALSR